MPQILKILLIMAIAIHAFSCASFNAKPPEGFAAYDDGYYKFRAISPDGVLYRVAEYEQKKEASVDFWREAFLLKMKNSNYKQEDSLNVTIGGKAAIGYIFSFAGSAGSDSYLVAAVPVGGYMVVVEAAGEREKFNARKEAILKAIGEIEL